MTGNEMVWVVYDEWACEMVAAYTTQRDADHYALVHNRDAWNHSIGTWYDRFTVDRIPATDALDDWDLAIDEVLVP